MVSFGVLEHFPYPGFTHLSTLSLCNTNITTPRRVCCVCVCVKDGRWDRMFHSAHILIHFPRTKPFSVPCSPSIHLPPDTHTHTLFNCDYSARSSLAHPSLDGHWAITTFFLHGVCVLEREFVYVCVVIA